MEENKSFEDAIKELEQIVAKLEKGEMSLDESVEEFQKGVNLANYCNTILQEAQKKIVLITENNGEIEENKFSYEE